MEILRMVGDADSNLTVGIDNGKKFFLWMTKKFDASAKYDKRN